MKRRTFLQAGALATLSGSLLAALRQDHLDRAVDVLEKSVSTRVVAAAVLHVVQRDSVVTRTFGAAKSESAMFLLGSITKPIAMTALMTLFDQGRFNLDDPVKKFIPGLKGELREQITLRHVLTHVSGLPDQLPENADLRKKHAPLSEFIDHAIQTPLSFAPGTKYQYSSMGILLAAHVAQIISGLSILELVERTVVQPLKLKHSALGCGQFSLDELIPVQTENAAPEAGAGDPGAKEWDWNSPYWRKLGAPWGGMHTSAIDLAAILAEFLFARGVVVKPSTARMMTTNHNPTGLTPRGLGFQIGTSAGSPGCSDKTFGHTGSTGTVAWADPETETICIVLTSLPGRAVNPHPRESASAHIAAAARS